jgi:ATP-binding cassette, subfamily C, bacteriocin exporter
MRVKIKQHDAMDCGAAALASICAHYKLQIPIGKVRQYANTDRRGTNLLGLVEASKKLGFMAKGAKLSDERDLSELDLPVIAHVLSQEKYPHYSVIYKVTDTYVKVMDPEYGEMKKVPINDFKRIMTGYLVLIYPDEGFKKGRIGTSKRKQIYDLIKPNRYSLIQMAIGALLYTVLGMATSIYIEKVTDYVLPNYNGNLMNLLSIIMILIIVVQLVIGIFRQVLNLRVGQIIDVKMILGYYKHLTKLPQSFFDNMRVGEIMSRINDAVKIRSFINDVAVSFFVNLCIVTFSFILMYAYNWKIALIITLCIPVYAMLYWISNRLNKKSVRVVMEKSAELQSQLFESINSMETIKLFNLEEHANIKTEEKFIELLKSMYRVTINNIGIFFSSDVFAKIFTIILFWSGTYFIFKNELSPGELFSFYSLIAYFTGPIEALVTANRPIQEATIAADRLFEIMDLDHEPDIDDQKIKLQSENLGDIRFENIEFRYGFRAKVFDNISFNIPYKKVTAIVGVSGSGKSTLMALLQKMYPLGNGKIYVGDYDLKYVSTYSLRSVISVVPQNIVLFAGSIIENITIGDPKPDMAKVFSICKELEILSFIETLPNGFETYVGENGTALSGGQRQRIGIARALYRDFDIFIMDEATSSLDSFSDSVVQKVVHSLKEKNKTIIIITHRLSSITTADNIIVLKDGKVIEEGTHTALCENNNYYAALWRMQI